MAAFSCKKLGNGAVAKTQDIGRCGEGGKGGKESSPAGASYNCINRQAAIG